MPSSAEKGSRWGRPLSAVDVLELGRRGASVLDDIGDDLVERPRRAPADRGADLVDRRLAVERVLDPEAVDLVVGDEDAVRLRARPREHAVGELEDADAFGRADVVDLAADRPVVHQLLQRADRVLDVAEGARLRAVAVDLERRARKRVADE